MGKLYFHYILKWEITISVCHCLSIVNSCVLDFRENFTRGTGKLQIYIIPSIQCEITHTHFGLTFWKSSALFPFCTFWLISITHTLPSSIVHKNWFSNYFVCQFFCPNFAYAHWLAEKTHLWFRIRSHSWLVFAHKSHNFIFRWDF